MPVEDHLLLRRRPSHRREACRFHLNACAQFQEFDGGRDPFRIDALERNGRPRRNVQYEHPRSLAGFHQAVGAQCRDGLANDRAAHAVGGGEPGFARQLAARRELP